MYSAVAGEVQRIAEADAERGRLEARALLGNINRKLVKQTVMTSVYGVTNIGARDQIKVRPSPQAPVPLTSCIMILQSYGVGKFGIRVLLLSSFAPEPLIGE